MNRLDLWKFAEVYSFLKGVIFLYINQYKLYTHKIVCSKIPGYCRTKNARIDLVNQASALLLFRSQLGRVVFWFETTDSKQPRGPLWQSASTL